MRCLTLANELSAHGATCLFVTRPFLGHLNQMIRQSGHEVVELPTIEQFNPDSSGTDYSAWLGTDWTTDAGQTVSVLETRQIDWLVADSYALDARWETEVSSICGSLMVIDDLADRQHNCKILLDQNLGRTSTNYEPLLGKDTETLIGPQFALLRPQFRKLRKLSLDRRKNVTKIRNILVTFGSSDPGNFTKLALEQIANSRLPYLEKITVVLGSNALWLEQVQIAARSLPVPIRVLTAVDNMAEIMTESDVAIGAAGSTSWERCCLGLPTIQLAVAANQLEAALAIEAAGAAISAKEPSQIASILEALSPERISALSVCASQICDGAGAGLVGRKMLNSL